MLYTNYQKTFYAKTIATKTPLHSSNSSSTISEITKYLTSSEVAPALGFLFVLIIFTNLLGKGKGKISSGRFVGKAEKLQATAIALKQIDNNQCGPCTLWSGTPNYWFGKKYRGISSWIQTALNSPPTTYFPHAERGMLVIGAPGSGKTFSVIDRAIESSFRQGFSTIIYDKKGDQMQLHVPIALRYGYSVQVFAPGEPYSGVINPLDFMSSPVDSTMAGEIGRIIMQNSSSSDRKGDEFFRSAGEMLAKGLVQLAKSSKYPDLAMVYAFIQLPNFVDRIEYAIRRDDSQKMNYWIAASFSQLLSSKDAEKTVAGIKATAEATYSSFIQKDLLRAFIGKSTIPLSLDGKQLIVFKLDDKRRSVIGPLLAAAIHLCIVENLSKKRKHPFVYSLDEFPSIKLGRIVNWVNEYRSNGGVPIVGIQSLNQLYDAYGDKQGASIASALSTHVLFNPGDYDTADKYSKRFGETELIIRNRSTGTSSGQHMSRSVNWNEQLQKKPLLSADEILRFPQGKCVISSPAYGNVREALFPYLLKIPVSAADRDRAKRSEELWEKSKIREQLEARTKSILGEISIDKELQNRLEEAYRILPMADEKPEEVVDEDKRNFEDFDKFID
jgi:type IV secretion system protein VirD4